ncbi:lysosomal Pro-X carboxypeptidase-like [Chenopodium quinoa]|uniref:lysosomal Pro-X carboxypeptidase-like n=1 Tax=Chenopodium quinoa TaxID=63459 RepID=UPI000B78304C|nr:lysosomal Pro-X carboxypeptidase-like [Chenopodium quinoa]
MLPARPFNFVKFKESCRSRFGISPNPHTPISFFKSKNLVESLTRFGGNIIFSNGLRDPFSSGGILDDLSDTIVVLTTTKGTSCLDLTTPNINYVDTKWLIEQREAEIKIFRQWIDHFHHISGSYTTGCSLVIVTWVQILVFLFIYLD